MSSGPAADRVRLWRPAADSVLMMAGTTTSYAIAPRGEYVFGLVQGQPMLSTRGRERRLIAPGQLVAWDPSAAHTGAAVGGRPWTARLMVNGPDTRAFGRACEYLSDRPERNIGLDELAAAAGIGKFRLIRTFAVTQTFPL